MLPLQDLFIIVSWIKQSYSLGSYDIDKVVIKTKSYMLKNIYLIVLK
jgi:hypothetical protein